MATRKTTKDDKENQKSGMNYVRDPAFSALANGKPVFIEGGLKFYNANDEKLPEACVAEFDESTHGVPGNFYYHARHAPEGLETAIMAHGITIKEAVTLVLKRMMDRIDNNLGLTEE